MAPVVPTTRSKRGEHSHFVTAADRSWLGAKCPPDDDAEIDERELEDDEHEDGFPDRHGHVVEQSIREIRPSRRGGSLHKPHTRIARVLELSSLSRRSAASKETL